MLCSYDCAVRRHAWEFAKQTLPRRGGFKTVYDALQLHTCNITPPAGLDVFVPPRFDTSASNGVIFADARAAAGTGDGSKAHPFAALGARLANAAPALTKTLSA